ncbi:acid-thiol ligase [Gracilaria domingensis]|nr:acid-thiol ligase [Gracilaria domingensis]
MSCVAFQSSSLGAPPSSRPRPAARVCRRRQVRLAVSPPQPPETRVRPQLYPPHVTPYPRPPGSSGQQALKVRSLQSIPELFHALAEPPTADLTALVDLHHSPNVELTFAQLAEQVNKCTAALRILGLRPHSNVALFSENSARWCIVDQAIMSAGAAAAVRGVSAPPHELHFILEHSESKVLFVENVSVLRVMREEGVDFSALQFIVLLFGHTQPAKQFVPDVPLYSFEDLMSMGANYTSDLVKPLAKRSDIATLLYTSGTTGSPKGVVLTHSNLLAQLEDVSLGCFDPSPGEVFLSILPCWHVFERTAAYWSLSKGMRLVYSNKRHFRDDLQKHKPHMLISVPRVFESLHGAVMHKMGRASALRRSLFAFFLGVSMAFIECRRRLNKQHIHSAPLKDGFSRALCALRMTLLTPLYGLANLLIWKKIRAGFGNRLRICLSGGGSLAGYLEDFFECAGIDICIGYGLTETSPVIANRFGENNVRGSTGTELPRAYVKIVDTETGVPVPFGKQGRLCVKGPYVFDRYWKNQGATAKAFDAEGYFDTGDLAYRALGGDIVISGRAKELIVLSNGENVEPAPIEDVMVASPLVDQIMLVGQDERSLGALVVPNLIELESQGLVEKGTDAKVKKLLDDEAGNRAELEKLEAKLMESKELMSVLNNEIERRNRERISYSSIDRVRHTRLLLTPFSVENGMMTQTLKLKKSIVADVYSKEIGAMYRK